MYRMAPWSNDQLLEYLLATRPDECADLITRVNQDPDRVRLQGSPELWTLVLDRLCPGDDKSTIRALIESDLERLLDETADPERVYCAARGFLERSNHDHVTSQLDSLHVDQRLAMLMRNRWFQSVCAA